MFVVTVAAFLYCCHKFLIVLVTVTGKVKNMPQQYKMSATVTKHIKSDLSHQAAVSGSMLFVTVYILVVTVTKKRLRSKNHWILTRAAPGNDGFYIFW